MPAKDFGNRDLIFKNSFEHPEALSFSNGDIGPKFDNKIEVFEYHGLQLRVPTASGEGLSLALVLGDAGWFQKR